MYVDSQKHQRQDPQQPAVQQSDFHFFSKKHQFLSSCYIFIHKHSDSYSKGLGTHVSRHVQNQRLETDHDGKRGNDTFENANYRGNQHTQPQKNDKPWQPLLHAAPGSFS